MNPDLNFPIVCQAEVDLPAWLNQLTGKPGWWLSTEQSFDAGESFTLRRGDEEAQVVLFNTGYVTVDVEDHVVYDGLLLDAHECAKLQYFNADSGEPIVLN